MVNKKNRIVKSFHYNPCFARSHAHLPGCFKPSTECAEHLIKHGIKPITHPDGHCEWPNILLHFIHHIGGCCYIPPDSENGDGEIIIV